jgi:hypothetical protein
MGNYGPHTTADLPLMSSQARDDRPFLDVRPTPGSRPPSAFTIPRKPLPTHAVAPIAENSDGDTVKGPASIKPPQYLQRTVIFANLVTFVALLAVIETLYQISESRQGLVKADLTLHYLWTYGPTAG